MWETFFGFKKAPFPDCPDAKQLFASQAWNQVKAVSGRAPRYGSVDRRSRSRKIHRRSHLQPLAESQLVQDPLPALDLRLLPGSIAPTGARTGPGAGGPQRGSGPSDLRHHRAFEPKQKTASHSDLR